MENNLQHTLVYLSGPMDFAADHGVGWRNEFKERTKHLQLKALDPCSKPGGIGSEVDQEKDYAINLKKTGRFDELTKFAKKIRRIDLRLVDLCDFVVVYIDKTVPMCGTWDELFIAERQKKPVLVIYKQGKKEAPLWLFAAVNHKFIFDDMDSLIKYLEEVNAAKEITDTRWVLIRKFL